MNLQIYNLFIVFPLPFSTCLFTYGKEVKQIILMCKISQKFLRKIKVSQEWFWEAVFPPVLEVWNGGYIMAFRMASDWWYMYQRCFCMAYQIPPTSLDQKHELNSHSVQRTHKNSLFLLNLVWYRRISE